MPARQWIHGIHVATAHQSGVIPITQRRLAAIDRANADGASAEQANEEAAADHAPENAHADSARNGVTGGLNASSVNVGKLQSLKRWRARLESARDLDDAKRISGLTGADIGAALDYDRKIVARVLCAEAPFEVAHLRLLPWMMAGFILGRLAALLCPAGRAAMEEEERRVREAANL